MLGDRTQKRLFPFDVGLMDYLAMAGLQNAKLSRRGVKQGCGILPMVL